MTMENKNALIDAANGFALAGSTSTSNNLTQFEKDAIGHFLLKLYHDSFIQPDGLISKQTVRNEFLQFVKVNGYQNQFSNMNVGTLIRVSRFLRNTPRKSKMYCVYIPNLMLFRNEKMKQLEKEYSGMFLLKLLHNFQIPRNGLVKQLTITTEFKAYLEKSSNQYQIHFSEANIGTLMRNSKLLMNTPRGSGSFCIAMRNLFQFRNGKLSEMDNARIQNYKTKDKLLLNGTDDSDKPFEANIEISPDAEEFPVIYQGGCEQRIKPNFTLTSTGCYICQKNFQMQSDFEDHVSTHGFESDFEFLSTFEIEKENIFDVVYCLCNNSHFFNFTMKTGKRDIVIEKIIVIQTRMMHFVKNNNFPCEISSDGIYSFLVDSHLFTMGLEQPIVVVYRHKLNTSVRFVEQYHFLNTHKKRSIRIRQKQNVVFSMDQDIISLIDDILIKNLNYLLDMNKKLIDNIISQLDETKVYTQLQRTEDFPKVHFPIRACRLPCHKVMTTKFPLADYLPSNKVKLAQKTGFSDESLSALSVEHRKYVTEGKVLNPNNVSNVLNTLIEIEDLEGMNEYLQFREKGATIKRFGREYSVKFRKLPKHVNLEGTVSPLDQIILIPSGEPNIDEILENPEKPYKKRIKRYFATIERVYYNQICFQYKNETICEKKKYDIVVRPSRLGIKYQYKALNMLTSSTMQYIMPQCNYATNNVSTVKLELFNTTIENNPEQLQAVRNIADGPSSSAPYVIFGPPGTGKTSTVVEAVLQLWKRRPETRILITAGSNSACDEVALRLCRVLIDLQPDKMNVLRIFAKSNEKRIDSIDDILIEASNFYSGHFYPHVEVIREYRIIVCTLSVVGKLVTADIGSQFFTHIFVDECAASTVPEVLVGWVGTSSSKTRLIVSGDHNQLGPILKSKRAGELGLNVSYMEHLLKGECYAVKENGEYDRSIQTRLIRNYRSHPEIVGLYNRMYYNNELKAMANEEETLWGLHWHLLPKRDHPMIFHSVYGSSMKNDKSLSLCNEKEVDAVMEYVKDLMYFGIKGRKIEETDIGIISPYKKQYIRIQEELNRRRWHQIEVGAVETFQGKEKPIIIVSTVRSFTRTLGFLENPRRLNVILSRAKALLIIIGNPITLGKNKDFRYIIDECRRNKCTIGGFRGYDPESPDEQLKNALNKLSLKNDIFHNFVPALAEETRKTARFRNQNSLKTTQFKCKPAKKTTHKYTSGLRSKAADVDEDTKKLTDIKELQYKLSESVGTNGLTNKMSTCSKNPSSDFSKTLLNEQEMHLDRPPIPRLTSIDLITMRNKSDQNKLDIIKNNNRLADENQVTKTEPTENASNRNKVQPTQFYGASNVSTSTPAKSPSPDFVRFAPERNYFDYEYQPPVNRSSFSESHSPRYALNNSSTSGNYIKVASPTKSKNRGCELS